MTKATSNTAASYPTRRSLRSVSAARTSPELRYGGSADFQIMPPRPSFAALTTRDAMKQLSGPMPDGTPRLDGVRKMTQLAYFDEVFEAAVKTPAIVDAIEDLLSCPDIKLYTDQLMMKPRFNGEYPHVNICVNSTSQFCP